MIFRFASGFFEGKLRRKFTNKNLKSTNAQSPPNNMNTPSPLLPQGALPPQAHSTIPFKILMVLGIHVVVIGGLLLQGCKDNKENSTAANSASDQATLASNLTAAPAPADNTPAPTPLVSPLANNEAALPSTAAPPPTQPLVAPVTAATPPVSTAPPPAAAPATGAAREYVIARGDTLGAIARKNGISLSALEDANPGVNPRKLQIGQKIQIPESTTAGATATAATGGAAEAAGVETITYTVKAGDMLAKIAKAHGTRVKTIMEMNDLKTTAIRVGQKLKLPVIKTAMAELPAASPATAQSAPASAPAPSTVASGAPSAQN
jgi:LysM repeat protein